LEAAVAVDILEMLLDKMEEQGDLAVAERLAEEEMLVVHLPQALVALEHLDKDLQEVLVYIRLDLEAAVAVLALWVQLELVEMEQMFILPGHLLLHQE
jgi:hypothetical protein